MLDRRGALSEEEVRHVTRQLCEVIAFIHSRNVIHRDIKPANVMIVHGPDADHFVAEGSLKPPTRVKLVDFGIGRVVAPKRTRGKVPRPKRKHVERLVLRATRKPPPKPLSMVKLVGETCGAEAEDPSSQVSPGVSSSSQTSKLGESSRSGYIEMSVLPLVEVSCVGSPLYEAPELKTKESAVTKTTMLTPLQAMGTTHNPQPTAHNPQLTTHNPQPTAWRTTLKRYTH